MKKITVPELHGMKSRGEKIVMVTAYDTPTANIIDEAGVDIILVGDSLGNVIQGHPNTLPVTMDEMIYHTKIVSRGVGRAHLSGDMPFMSYQASKEEAIRNAGRFIKEGGAESVKLETNENYLDTIYAIQKAGIPVMGHIGLCPQSIHITGGYKIQGRDNQEAERLLELAKSTEEAGAFSLVLESIPRDLARRITESVNIPTIGIGAGSFCDGQVLVINDLVGLSPDPLPKFVKRYVNLREHMANAVRDFVKDVKEGAFPDYEHSYNGEKKRLRIITSAEEMQRVTNSAIKNGKKISLVPTMGALHEGHINLIIEGRKRGDMLVVSVFVNPTQFGHNEDFTKYPRDLEGDLRKIGDLAVDIVFAPTLEEMYPDGFQTYLEIKELQEQLCGRFRPGHFRGVATVVLKLFNIVKPHIALFGEKDYQQLKIVQRMVKDLNLEVEVVGYPIVRDKDGLALSSRNTYLSTSEKNSAYGIPIALREIKKKFDKGCRDTKLMIEFGKKILEKAGIKDIDYLEICDSETLERRELAEIGNLVAVAVRIGGTRLIDNIRL